MNCELLVRVGMTLAAVGMAICLAGLVTMVAATIIESWAK